MSFDWCIVCTVIVLGFVFPYQAERLACITSPKWPILCWVGHKTLTSVWEYYPQDKSAYKHTKSHRYIIVVVYLHIASCSWQKLAKLWETHCWQHCSQRKVPVFKLLRGWFWGFSPRRGDTLHRRGWNLARTRGQVPSCTLISPPSVQR